MTQTITLPNSSTGPLDERDPRHGLARATVLARLVTQRVTPENATMISPCPEWDARSVAGHIIAVLDRLAGFTHGIPAEDLPFLHDLRVDQLETQFDRAAHALQEAWSSSSVLSQMLVLPFATLPGSVAARFYTSELLVHTWDLATAIQVPVQWPDDLILQILPGARAGIPLERGPGIPFGPVPTIPDNAPPIAQLVAWLGRRP